MPGCCVLDCKNSVAKDFRLFAFPSAQRNSERRKVWLSLVQRPDFNDSMRICEVHFSEGQFEKGRQDGKKFLRPCAIPDLLQKNLDCIEPHPKRRCDEEETVPGPSHTDNDDALDFQDVSTENEDIDTEIFENVDPLEERVEKQNEVIKKLRQQLKAALTKCRQYEKKMNKRMDGAYYKLFNEDQLEVLKNGTCRGGRWSDDTVTKGLKLYMACGTKGYEEILRQNLPYPSIRTLQHRISKLKFKPGILQEVFDLLALKMESFQCEEKHAALLVDEMAITPGLQFDNSLQAVIGRPTLNVPQGKNKEDQIATHGMVYMLRGISTKWKQIVGYDFTANAIDPHEFYERLIEVVKKAHKSGLTIRAVVSDMGGQNRSLWKILHIMAGKHTKIQNSITHPCLPSEKLFFLPDAVHVLKNLAAALCKGHLFIVGDNLVQKYHLPSNEISIEPIKQLHELDKCDVLKLCPRLKEEVLNPSHFDKMNAKLSTALINNDVAAGLLYYISQKKIHDQHTTTAWFIKVIHKWFKLLTGRYADLALSLKKEEHYNETIDFLKSVQEIAYNITVSNTWKPFQTGILLITQTALDLQKIYLEKENFGFLMLGRFTQDALENAFSSIRCRQPVPSAHLFRVSLRLVCLSQFETQVKRSNYPEARGHYVVKYCNSIENQGETETIDEEATIEKELLLQLDHDSELTVQLNNSIQASLYYLLGAILHKVKNNQSVCNKCYKCVKTDAINISHLTLFTKMKEYKENVLEFPTMDLFNYICSIELYFRQFQCSIIDNVISFNDFVQQAWSKYPPLESVPPCHNTYTF